MIQIKPATRGENQDAPKSGSDALEMSATRSTSEDDVIVIGSGMGGMTTATDDPIQSMFVSFPSLKDPAHEPGPSNRHTGDWLVLADWGTIAEFAEGGSEKRPTDWLAFKENVESKLIAFFAEKFPALMPLLVYRELGTPLATALFTRHENGGFYGIETTPRRMLSDAFRVRTPVPNLFLTGQDVMTPGIAGALAGGLLGAAAIDPRVYQKLMYS